MLTLHRLSLILSSCLNFSSSYFSTLLILISSNFSLKVGLYETISFLMSPVSRPLSSQILKPYDSNLYCLLMHQRISVGSLFFTQEVKMRSLMKYSPSALRIWLRRETYRVRSCYFWTSSLQREFFCWISGRLVLRFLLYLMGRNIIIYPKPNHPFKPHIEPHSLYLSSFPSLYRIFSLFTPKLQILTYNMLPSFISQQLTQKYQNSFFAHFANPINELVYDNVYTEYRISTKDFLCGISDIEYMIAYASHEPKKYEAVVWFNAELFESPLRITCEMPLMILTDTKEIFERRKKRLKKLMNNDMSSNESKSSSFSSIFSHSTVVVLDQSTSDITFMNLSSSGCNSLSTGSYFNVYFTPSRISQEQSIKIELRESQVSEHLSIKELVESQLKHLIIEFNSRTSTEVVESVRSKRNPNLHDFSQQIKDYDPNEAKPPSTFNHQIQSVVKAELKKYNIGQMIELSSLNSSSRQSKSKMKVRDKAEELLRNIRISSIM